MVYKPENRLFDKKRNFLWSKSIVDTSSYSKKSRLRSSSNTNVIYLDIIPTYRIAYERITFDYNSSPWATYSFTVSGVVNNINTSSDNDGDNVYYIDHRSLQGLSDDDYPQYSNEGVLDLR